MGVFSETNDVFKGVIVSTSSSIKGDLRLAYNGKLRVFMECFIHRHAKERQKGVGFVSQSDVKIFSINLWTNVKDLPS